MQAWQKWNPNLSRGAATMSWPIVNFSLPARSFRLCSSSTRQSLSLLSTCPQALTAQSSIVYGRQVFHRLAARPRDRSEPSSHTTVLAITPPVAFSEFYTLSQQPEPTAACCRLDDALCCSFSYHSAPSICGDGLAGQPHRSEKMRLKTPF